MLSGDARADALMSESKFNASIREAAGLLSRARLPLVTGLRTDIAGVVAAVRLAERIGGVLDHDASAACLDEGAVLKDIGLMFVTPAAAYREADTLLIVGEGALQKALENQQFFSERLKHVVAVGAPERAVRKAETIALMADVAGFAAQLATVRARVNGRPLTRGFDVSATGRGIEVLTSAHYGVVLWSPDELGALEIEMLMGLVKDLNESTRWSALATTADQTAVGATMALGWMTGFPLRTSFARGYAEHDPWRFEGRRLVESGEADIAVWISASSSPPPEWLARVPTIALSSSERTATALTFVIGEPGRDHDGVLYDAAIGTLVERRAATPTNLRSAASVLTLIRQALPAS
jgi:formylmethanofuran dehydrogenase subunit B